MSALRRAVLGLVLVAATGCGSGPGGSAAREPVRATPEAVEPTESRGSSTGTVEPPTEAPATTSSASPPRPACDQAPAVVEVTGAEQLQDALDAARPGQTIRLADGVYPGTFVATARGTEEAPIRLCGSRDAVIDGGDIDGDYTLHLQGARSWHLLGFTVTGGQKGVMVDAGTGHRIEGLLVTSMGDEAIHLRTNSSDNVVVGNVIRDTGLRKPKYGEGIYVGSAESNWCSITDCLPDRSDGNVIAANEIAGTTAEAVDIKEGTTGGVLRDNVFDGSALEDADSWVDVKGNGWRIEGNRGSTSPVDGFQVHEVVDGWGRDAVFAGNVARDVPGLAINAAGSRTLRGSTTVDCDNATDGPGSLSNVTCSSG